MLAALPRSCIIPYTTQDEVQARQAIAKKAEAAQGNTAPAGGTPPPKKKKHPAPEQPAAATVPPQSQIVGRSY